MVETVLGIDGMMCDMCEVHINDVVRKNFAVKSVKSNHRKGSCTIVSEDPLDEEALRAAIADTGYELTSLESGPQKKRGFLPFL